MPPRSWFSRCRDNLWSAFVRYCLINSRYASIISRRCHNHDITTMVGLEELHFIYHHWRFSAHISRAAPAPPLRYKPWHISYARGLLDILPGRAFHILFSFVKPDFAISILPTAAGCIRALRQRRLSPECFIARGKWMMFIDESSRNQATPLAALPRWLTNGADKRPFALIVLYYSWVMGRRAELRI